MNNEVHHLQEGLREVRFGHISSLLAKMLVQLRRWRQLSYERRLLGSLDHHMLRDIGISRADAERESGRPFWDDQPLPPRLDEQS